MKAKKKILSLLLAIAMILGMLPMTALPVYAANATQIKIWNGTEMQTYTLGTDTLPDGLSWNSTDNRLELDGYNGGRIEYATSGDELTFYVLNDSTIDGGEEFALNYSYPTIDGATGKTLTLTGTKNSVMYIEGTCTIKNITVKVDQAGTVSPNGYTTATSGNIKVNENGRLEVNLDKQNNGAFPAQGCGNLSLYDNGSAKINVTANAATTQGAYGVMQLYLYGTGVCDIQVTNNGTGETKAVQYGPPTVPTHYNVTGAWDSPSVNYKTAYSSVTVLNDGNGTASANPAAAAAGTEIILTASPNSGKQFKEWQVISGSVTITDNKFTMPNEDVIIKAIFEDKIYSISVLVAGTTDCTASANPAEAPAGTEITLTATPGSGERFKEWEVLSGDVTITDNKFTMSTKDVTIRAIFEYVTVTGVSLDQNTLSLVAGGEAGHLVATVDPADANQNVSWSSSDESVATVNNGAVTPLSVGTATITVTTAYGSKTASCTVTVTAATVPVTGISLNKTDLFLAVGNSETLSATVTPEDATNKTVTWSSSNTGVATVDESGIVTAVAAGTATITAKTVDGGFEATSEVQVATAFYTVTFDSDGGTAVPPATVAVGEKVVKPADPKKAGFVLQEWQSGSTAYDFNTAVTANITLKAIWTAAPQIKVWDGSEMQTYTLGADVLPTGLFWNSADNRLELDGYSGGRIERVNTTDELTFYVKSDSTIDGGGETALLYNKTTIDGVAGKNLTLKGTKETVMKIIGGTCDIKNITVKVEQSSTGETYNNIFAISGYIHVRENGKLDVIVDMKNNSSKSASGATSIFLHDNGSANIQVTADNYSKDAFGVLNLYLEGAGDCDITVSNTGSGATRAVRDEPTIPAHYDVTGAWNNPSVSYKARDAETNADLKALDVEYLGISPAFVSSVISYNLTTELGYGYDKINIKATTYVEGASLTINGETATSGVYKEVQLNVGVNAIPIVVTAKDSSTTKTYTLKVTRESGGSYNLTVNNGSKNPNTDTVEAGTTVTISADVAPVGKLFDKWTEKLNKVTFANAENPTTTFIMPTQHVEVTANYKIDQDKDTVLASITPTAHYSGGGTRNLNLTPYFAGETRDYTVKAALTDLKMHFNLKTRQEGQTVTATVDGANLTVNSVTEGLETAVHTLTKAKTVFVFTVKSKDNTTEGTYKVTVNRGTGTTYALTVNKGTADNYTPAAGDMVTITADAPGADETFDRWTGTEGMSFNDANSATTTFIMPEKAVTVTANYKTDPNKNTALNDIVAWVETYSDNFELRPLDPVFNAGTREYVLNLLTDIDKIKFNLEGKVAGQTITATADGADFTVNTTPYYYTDPFDISKNAKTVFIFTVTAKDGETKGTYTVTVNRATNLYDITVQDDGNGTASASQAMAVKGAEITLTATPNTGKQFKEWQVVSGSVTITDNKFTMPASDVTIKAIFEDIKVTGVSLDQDTLSLVAGGATGTLVATVTPANAANRNVTWSSSNETVATVANGVVTPLSAGTATITVTTVDGSKTATCTVTVTAAPVTVTSIAVNSTSHKTAYKVGESLDVTGLTIEATMSDTSKQTINVTAPMVTGFNSSAAAVSQTLTITYDGKTATYNISIAKADGPAAPTGLVGVKPTTSGGSDGKITGTTNLMEYANNSAFSTPTACTGTEITGLSAGTYYVRVKETATHKAGAYATVTVPEGSTATVTSIAVNSTSHKTAYKVGETLDVTNLTILVTKSDSTTETINVISGMVTGFDSSAVAASQTLTITYDGKTTTYNITIAKADGPAAPTGLAGVKPTTAGGSDGKITGTTNLMEYSTDSSFSSPTACSGTETTGLSAGTYYVRVKETATHEAGTYAAVTVPAGSTATVTSIAVNSTSHKTAYKVGETLDVTNLTILVTKSDSTTETINVTSGMVTGFDSSAVSASQTLTITYDGKTTTYNISIAKADGPAAPTGLVGVKPTTAGGTDGKLTGTTNLMEYADNSLFSSPTDCTGTEITGLSAGTYYVRIKETATHKAGASATVTVPAGSTATVTSIAVNSTSHKIAYKVGETFDVTGLTIEATMSDTSKQTINVTDPMVTGFNSSAAAASQTLTITYDGKTTTYNITIGKADGAAAPTGLVGVKPTTAGGTDGRITGTTALMEYATDSAFTSPTDCTDTETTGLSAGTYYVRVKETATHEAGAYATVTVPEGGTATVTITGVTVSPSSTSVEKGGTQTFTAIVSGTGAYNNTVTWSVYGGVAGTTIDYSGILTIDIAETATTLTVTAESNGDSVKKGTATVTITDMAVIKYILTVNNGSGSGEYAVGDTVNIYAGNRSGYTFTGWTSSDVTITNASNKNASFTMPAKNVTVTANWSYSGGGGGGGRDRDRDNDSGSSDSGGSSNTNATPSDSKAELEETETDTQEEKPTVEETVKFEDVKSGEWFYEAVNYAYNAGLMKGIGDTNFNPYTDATRGMIVTILHRLEGTPKASTANSFTDVGADKYFTDAVAWASNNRIVSGYGDGIFGPENSITREQLAVILMNYAQYKGYNVSIRADLSEFADGEHISLWAKDAMSWANAEGLIQGSGNQLMPRGNAQRCQVAAILQRFLEIIAK